MKSHLIPRRLVHDVRGPASHVLAGASDRQGRKHLQGGMFDDDLLCELHEGMLAAADDYGIRFLRRCTKQGGKLLQEGVRSYPNSAPERLTRFAASLTWRRGASPVFAPPNRRKIGARERALRSYLFEGGKWEPHIFVVHEPLLHRGVAPVRPMISQPIRDHAFGPRGWRFRYGDLSLVTVLDDPAAIVPMMPFRANDADPVLAIDLPPVELTALPNFLKIIGNMGKPPPRGGW